MAANRYGQIWHGDHHHINIRFPSNEARLKFEQEFDAYHASHDHEGEVPIFKLVNSADLKLSTGSRSPEDLVKAEADKAYRITIDGYSWSALHDYHNPRDGGYEGYFHYRVPTCCVPPIIAVNREFVDSNTLQRHALSAIFGDMPDEDYKSLRTSVEKDGFIDNVVRIYEGQILDGWHRYRAAKELNLIRRLRFTDWNEDAHRDGDPKVFVLARNIERRHLNASQRAQIAVAFNERFGHGGDRSKTPNGVLKTKKELAKQAGVGTSTIDRAVAVEKEGESEAVIAGEKTAGEVLKARHVATAKKRKKQVLKNLWDMRKQSTQNYIGDSDTDLNQYLTQDELEKGFVKNNETYAEAFESGMKRIDAASGSGFKGFVDRAFEVDEFGNAKVNTSDLEAEYRAIMTYAGDLRQWERPDWSPDVNWILPLIEAKKAKASSNVTDEAAKQMEKDYPKSLDEAIEGNEPEEETVDSLWEQITPAISAWKSARKDKGVGRASKSMFIAATKCFHNLPKDAETDVDLLSKLINTVTERYGPSYTFERYIQMQCNGSSIWEYSAKLDALDNKEKARQQVESVLAAFRNILKGHHVLEIDECLDDILHFFKGIALSDLPDVTEEELKGVVDFFQPLLLTEVSAWPEYIRHQFREKELAEVSIGITFGDDFEMVEFTDEYSDEIQVALNDLPKDLRERLLNIAAEKVYAHEMRELEDKP